MTVAMWAEDLREVPHHDDVLPQGCYVRASATPAVAFTASLNYYLG